MNFHCSYYKCCPQSHMFWVGVISTPNMTECSQSVEVRSSMWCSCKLRELSILLDFTLSHLKLKKTWSVSQLQRYPSVPLALKSGFFLCRYAYKFALTTDKLTFLRILSTAYNGKLSFRLFSPINTQKWIYFKGSRISLMLSLLTLVCSAQQMLKHYVLVTGSSPKH